MGIYRGAAVAGAGQRAFCKEGEEAFWELTGQGAGEDSSCLQLEAARLFSFCRRLTAELWDSGHMGTSLGSAAHEQLLADGV